MAEDYNVESDLGFLRLMISDVTAGDGQVFQDTELMAVIARYESLELSAAFLLERIADNEALVAKVIRTQDLSTDGAKVAQVMRESAARFRADHDTKVAAEADDLAIVDYGPFLGVWPELVERPY